MNPLTGFVHEALSCGVSRKDITEELVKGGWTLKEISSALDEFVETHLPLPVPRKRVSSSPQETFIYLMLFAALFTTAFELGAILFSIIDLSLPLAGESAFSSMLSLRYGIATVIVAFPIFMICVVMKLRFQLDWARRVLPGSGSSLSLSV